MNSANSGTVPQLSISECKTLIQNYYRQIWDLQTITSQMDDNDLEKLSSVVNQKYELDIKLNELKRQTPILAQKLKNRLKKRQKLRRKKEKIFQETQMRRQEIHNKIDRDMEQTELKFEQEQATIIAGKEKHNEIREFKVMMQEASNQLASIAAISMLRLQKISAATIKPDDDENREFQKKASAISDMWKEHIEKLDMRLQSLIKSPDDIEVNQNARNNMIFGDPHFDPNPLNSMSLDNLISIRRKWDVYVTGDDDCDGSYIPKEWIEASTE